ncbi:hypothetical protein, partial [Mesorhizobium sp. M7A.F.Ca.US.001.02.1.1]|uniref:hypothetical protein n=1 Tax=Mesorhizobium sp. M7A.F.Ca.US.001.02.1.1 TaxID=2496703 RepID=UPI0032AEBD81
FQYVEHFPAHIARGADDRYLETHRKISCPSPLGFWRNPLAAAGSVPRAEPGRGWLGQGNHTVLVVVLPVFLAKNAVLLKRGDAPTRPAQ